MSRFIKIDNRHIVPGRVVKFDAGDVISILFKKEVTGFGLHFAPIQDNQAFNIRSINSSVGLDTYAPSQRFQLDGNHIQIHSSGDETIEVSPHRSGKQLFIMTKHHGNITHATKHLNHYKPPVWAYDYWFSTPWTRMNQQTVLLEIDTAHEHHLEPKVWLLDAGWASKDSYLDFNKALFPDENNIIKVLHHKGVKPILWMSPFIDERTKIWNEFDKNGWLIKNKQNKSALFAITGDNDSLGSYLDYTSKSFVEYLSNKVSELQSIGLKGIMFDFGEALPDESRLSCETDSAKQARSEGLIGHNWYVGEIKRVLSKITEPLGLCMISRSGWTDTYAHTGLWLGDQSSDTSRFAGLESVLWGYKTAYDAGYRFIGMDAGGYFGLPSVTDYEKWLDLSVTMPFTMLHGAKQANPWEVGDSALKHFRKVRELHRKIWQNPEDVDVKFKLNWNKQKIESVCVNKYNFSNNSTD